MQCIAGINILDIEDIEAISIYCLGEKIEVFNKRDVIEIERCLATAMMNWRDVSITIDCFSRQGFNNLRILASGTSHLQERRQAYELGRIQIPASADFESWTYGQEFLRCKVNAIIGIYNILVAMNPNVRDHKPLEQHSSATRELISGETLRRIESLLSHPNDYATLDSVRPESKGKAVLPSSPTGLAS